MRTKVIWALGGRKTYFVLPSTWKEKGGGRFGTEQKLQAAKNRFLLRYLHYNSHMNDYIFLAPGNSFNRRTPSLLNIAISVHIFLRQTLKNPLRIYTEGSFSRPLGNKNTFSICNIPKTAYFSTNKINPCLNSKLAAFGRYRHRKPPKLLLRQTNIAFPSKAVQKSVHHSCLSSASIWKAFVPSIFNQSIRSLQVDLLRTSEILQHLWRTFLWLLPCAKPEMRPQQNWHYLKYSSLYQVRSTALRFLSTEWTQAWMFSVELFKAISMSCLIWLNMYTFQVPDC